MCVTGAALSFEKNIVGFAERSERVVAVGENRLSPQEILAKTVEARPKGKPTALLVKNDPAAAVAFSFGREGQMFVDPLHWSDHGRGE